MSTLPRSHKSHVEKANNTLPEFDYGLNTSAAWVLHQDQTALFSADEQDHQSDVEQAARALYHFDGKMEFKELSVESGDTLLVIKEDLADGWSLVRNIAGEVGLLPRTYYTFTSDFTSRHIQEPSSATIKPADSNAAIIPQNTGEWITALRNTVMGGKTLNRFAPFVASGAEDWILNGVEDDDEVHHQRTSSSDSDDADASKSNLDKHFIDESHAWISKLPQFSVMVHSPSTITSTVTPSYTLYSVTSLFEKEQGDESGDGTRTPTQVTVFRRFSHFVGLHNALERQHPSIGLPPLPEKQYAGRFNDDFVEARRNDLERYINKISRHRILRYAEVVTLFLSCEDDVAWTKQLALHAGKPAIGASFFSRVFHPAFSIDLDDASDIADRFQRHTAAIGTAVDSMRSIFGKLRTARLEASRAEKNFSLSLLALISEPSALPDEDDEDSDEQRHVPSVLNRHGAWCWREECLDCLSLTKAIQRSAETIHEISDLYEDQARHRQLRNHESMKIVAHPALMYEAILNTHREAISKYRDATTSNVRLIFMQKYKTILTSIDQIDEEMASRAETVLNTTLAELETYHTQKNEDFAGLMRDHLDGEIEMYEQIIARLKAARSIYDEPSSASPRQSFSFEKEMIAQRETQSVLRHPAPHVHDSAPMRPVGLAVQEGVGLLIGETRASVFGRFW